ncbi:hypothetical protein ACWD3J_49110 [Streptomyces sp. NPDC002755]|uniref:hypothetical protein n=1 Tax=Streptomyces sp. NPDC002884 TaxID=3154544 RepID=UPI0033337265
MPSGYGLRAFRVSGLLAAAMLVEVGSTPGAVDLDGSVRHYGGDASFDVTSEVSTGFDQTNNVEQIHWENVPPGDADIIVRAPDHPLSAGTVSPSRTPASGGSPDPARSTRIRLLVTAGRRTFLRLARHWLWASDITATLERPCQLPTPGFLST